MGVRFKDLASGPHEVVNRDVDNVLLAMGLFEI